MQEKHHAVIIGGGIGGLVAANYLRKKGGFKVTLLERKDRIGGACRRDSVEINGQILTYPTGATVLGLMQKFVFEETGLSKRLSVFAPNYEKAIYSTTGQEEFSIPRDPALLAKELLTKLDEKGDVEGFRRDETYVVKYLQKGYRNAQVPTLESAVQELGSKLTSLWITGSAEDLLNHYFTSERVKIYMGMTVIESGPTSYKSPYSAFTIPLYDSGSIFDGYWGYVAGGLWAVTETLGQINQEAGVNIITSAQVVDINPKTGDITYSDDHGYKKIQADYIIFGTDPMTASKLLGQLEIVQETKFLGTSGKLILAFKNQVRWKDATKEPDSKSAFRFIFNVDTLEQLERNSQLVASGKTDFAPGYIQIYSEGSAQRRLGANPPFDLMVLFFKNLGFGKKKSELPDVQKYIQDQVLARISNPEDLVWQHLFSPKDLQELFFFPKGHIEHTEITAGQQAWKRTFSSNPAESFYRFGDFERVYICGASVYPCGSVNGTGGYMCAEEIMRNVKKS